MGCVHWRETGHETPDGTEDGAKVARNVGASGSDPQATLSPESEKQEEYEQQLEA